MPTQGWVRFDPTPRSQADNPGLFQNIGFDPSEITPVDIEDETTGVFPNTSPADTDLQQILERLLGAEFEDPGIDALLTGLDIEKPFPLRSVIAGLLALGIAAIPSFKFLRRRRRMSRLRDGDVSAAWDEIVDRLGDVGAHVPGSATPLEVATSTTDKMVPLAVAYGERIYGPEEMVHPSASITKAELSYDLTQAHIQREYGKARRLFAWLRPGSLRKRRRR